MEKYLTIAFHTSYCDASIQYARRFTEEEKKDYSEWFADCGFISLGDHIQLENITFSDAPDRKSDGQFLGTNNYAYIITEEERDYYINLDKKRQKEDEEKELAERVDYLKSCIEAAERQRDLPTMEEAKRRMKAYNSLQNEDGDGYVPHIYSREEYERIKAEYGELTGNF